MLRKALLGVALALLLPLALLWGPYALAAVAAVALVGIRLWRAFGGLPARRDRAVESWYASRAATARTDAFARSAARSREAREAEEAESARVDP